MIVENVSPSPACRVGVLELRGLSLSARYGVLRLESVSQLPGVETEGVAGVGGALSLDRENGLLRPLKSLGGFIRRSKVPKLLVSESEKSDMSLGLPLFRELFLEIAVTDTSGLLL